MSASAPLPMRLWLTQDGLPPATLNPNNIFATQVDGNTRTWFVGPTGLNNWLLDSVEIISRCDASGVIFPNPGWFKRGNNLVNGVTLRVSRNNGGIETLNFAGNAPDTSAFRINSTATLWSLADDVETSGVNAVASTAIICTSFFFYAGGMPLYGSDGYRVEFVTRDPMDSVLNLFLGVLAHVRAV